MNSSISASSANALFTLAGSAVIPSTFSNSSGSSTSTLYYSDCIPFLPTNDSTAACGSTRLSTFGIRIPTSTTHFSLRTNTAFSGTSGHPTPTSSTAVLSVYVPTEGPQAGGLTSQTLGVPEPSKLPSPTASSSSDSDLSTTYSRAFFLGCLLNVALYGLYSLIITLKLERPDHYLGDIQ